MNLNIGKDTKKNILTSLLASLIFVTFINPIMNFIWDVFIMVSNATFDKISNIMFHNAAYGQRNENEFIILSFILFTSMAIAILVIIKVEYSVKDILDERKLKGMDAEDAKNHLQEKKLMMEKNRIKLEKLLIFLNKFSWPLISVSVVCTLGIIFMSYSNLQLNTSFNQRIEALAPYITENETKLLKSKWAFMKNRNDFLEINMLMDSLAKNGKIVLPKNLLD